MPATFVPLCGQWHRRVPFELEAGNTILLPIHAIFRISVCQEQVFADALDEIAFAAEVFRQARIARPGS